MEAAIPTCFDTMLLPPAPPLGRPAVCQYLGACRDPPCLIMEYCSKRSLDQLLSAGLANPKGATAKQLTWGRLLNMALDAAKGKQCC